MLRAFYRAAARALHRAPLPAGRLQGAIEGRREAADRWVAWARLSRTDVPLIWVHAASVGEAQTAEPVVARLRQRVGDVQIILTCSSPSAARWSHPFADRSDFVPLDESDPIGRALDALRPSVLVFSRGDLWPVLVDQAYQRRIPIAVIGAGIRARSARLLRPLRSLYGPLHMAVSWLGAVTEADAHHWLRLGVPQQAIQVTGDPRHDRVLERTPAFDALTTMVAWAEDRRVLLAGSTDRFDHEMLIDSAARVLPRHEGAALVIVPHEPCDAATRKITARAGHLGIACSSWDGDGDDLLGAPVIIVTAKGYLADLYALADIAYVGGGFRRNGLHSVIEPAAYATPVIVGPNWLDAADAPALVAGGGATALPRRAPVAALVERWCNWLVDQEARVAAGLAARRALTEGAAGRTARKVEELMS